MNDVLNFVPPHSDEAEKGVLVSCIIRSKYIDDVAMILRGPEDFYTYTHQTIFRHLLGMSRDDKPIDSSLLLESLREAKDIEAIGGEGYLIEMVTAGVPSAEHAVYYAEKVRDHARRREMIRASSELLRLAYDQQTPLDDLHSKADQLLNGIDATTSSDPITAEAALLQAVEALDRRARGDAPPALTTGLSDLDRMLGGMRPGELIILAARPGMGKTALALGIADHVTTIGKTTLFVSLEMSARELIERVCSARSGVDGSQIRDGKLLDDERRSFDTSAAKVSRLPLWIDSPNSITAFDIVSNARRMRRKHGLELLIVDYLGLVTAENPKDPRHEQVAKTTRRAKQIARELGIPIILICQLNRESEKGGDHRPRLSHLRESGSIEQDADVVLFVHRDEYYRPNDPDERGKAEIIVAKNRNGATGTVEVTWISETTKFASLSRAWSFA